jgi:hypothetical protein
MSLVLFETTESVIEVLWDIALAFFVIRIGLVYFLLAFSTGTLVSYLVCTELLPIRHLTTPQSELAIVPIMLLLAAMWARFIIAYYEIPRVRSFRLAIGGLAAFFMVFAELLTAFIMYEEGIGDWILDTDVKAGLAFGGLLLAYGLMPAILMVWEKRPEEMYEMSHGHGKKSMKDAV